MNRVETFLWGYDDLDRQELVTTITENDHVRVEWTGAKTDFWRPQTVMELYDGNISARIYGGPQHEEPLITVVFARDGSVTEMLVRRSPLLPIQFEDIRPCPRVILTETEVGDTPKAAALAVQPSTGPAHE